jgi:hypothetical protein
MAILLPLAAMLSLVGDATFLFYLIEALMNSVESELEGAGRAEKFEEFINRLNQLLNAIASRTTDGAILVSRRIYEEELRISDATSSIRRNVPDLETMCRARNANYVRVEERVQAFLHVSETAAGQVHELRQCFEPNLRPQDRDATALFLSVITSQTRDTILLTDDGPLIIACDHLTHQGEINLPCGTFQTARLQTLTFMDFLKWAHEGCHISSEQFGWCFSVGVAIKYARIDETAQPSKRRFLHKQLSKQAAAFSRSIILKGQQAVANHG